MNLADLYVRYFGPCVRWHKCSRCQRGHFMVFFGKNLACPSADAAKNKNNARNADSGTRHQAREAKRDSKGEKNRPRRASRHLDSLSAALFCNQVMHHSSPSDKVHDCKDHDPYAIYEVPVKSNCAEALALPRIDPTQKREDQRRAEQEHPYDYMGRVESDEGIKGGPKEICTDSQTVLIDQLFLFKRCIGQEDDSEEDRPGEPQGKARHSLAFDCSLCAPDRKTAREQADCANYRDL